MIAHLSSSQLTYCLIRLICYHKTMFSQIKKKIEKNLFSFLDQTNKNYPLSSTSPLLFSQITDFILRPGKRIRPILFVIGYKGYSGKSAPGLYQSALSFELLHDFMLIHDDVIDKSLTRRGKPSLHAAFNNSLKKETKAKFNGNDLAIIAGDVIYALAIDAFLAIKEKLNLKEKALRMITKAAAFTGLGEFIELIDGLKDIEKITKKQIYKVYDYKTAFYTFSAPLATGAILAGAGKKEIGKINEYGLCLGRAFQINDDILGMFYPEKITGKSSLSDLREAKKTLLIYYAYKNSPEENRKKIKQLFKKEKAGHKDLLSMRKIILKSKALCASQKEIAKLLKQSQSILDSLAMKKEYKKALADNLLPFFETTTSFSQHK